MSRPSEFHNLVNGIVAGALGGRPARKHAARRAPAGAAASSRVERLEGRTLFAVSLVSANAIGQAGGTGVISDDPEISADGRHVVFATRQSDVVPGVTDTNTIQDVYVRDLSTNTTVLVSGDSNNTAVGGLQPSISADGRYVAFVTSASLAAGDGNLTGQDVYVWDRLTPNTFTLVTGRASDGAAASGFDPSISNDGRVVAFVSSTTADIFQAGTTDANAARDVFVRNLNTNTTVLASAIPGGLVTANAVSDDPVLSGNGTAVAFHSAATDLTATPTSGGVEAYRRVLASPNVELVSVATPGGVATGGGSTSTVSISDDGNLVAFGSGSTDVVANDTNGNVRDIFVRNMTAGQTNVVSTNAAGERNALNASAPSLSGDGTHVAFNSSARNLVEPDAGTTDVFLKSLVDGSIRRVSQVDGGEVGNFGSTFPSVNSNGTAVAFVSQSTNLAPGTEPPAETDDDVFAFTTAPVTPPDAVAPTAAITAGNVTTAGGTTHTVTVLYTDNTAVSVASLGADDITVTGPGGAMTVTGVQVTPPSDGTPITATYALAAPGGTFDVADNGTYTITLPAGAVTDTAGNPVAAGTGTFSVAIGTVPPPTGGGADLVVTSVTARKRGLPPAVVGGSKGQVRVRITNQGDAAVAGPLTITLLARDVDPATASTADTAIATTPAKIVRLKPGKGRFVPIKFNYPDAPPASYSLVAVVDSGNQVTEGNEANNEGAGATPVTIAPAFIDLAATAIGSPARGAIPIGRRVSVPVTIENLGNSAASGVLKIDLYASTTGGNTVIDAGDVLIGTVSKNLRLKEGKRKVIRVSLPVDAALAPGQYFITAVINNPAAIAETSAANNVIVSATPSTAA